MASGASRSIKIIAYICSLYISYMKRLLVILSSLLIISACIKEEPDGADLKVGDMLPDFEAVMNNGTVVTDDDLMEGISVVMFFHTSCPDCQKALPVMQRIYDEYIENGVSFAIISREDVRQDIEFYWNREGLKMPFSAQEDRELYEKFASTRIPRIYINKNGIIRHIYTDDPVPGYNDLKNSLESLLTR